MKRQWRAHAHAFAKRQSIKFIVVSLWFNIVLFDDNDDFGMNKERKKSKNAAAKSKSEELADINRQLYDNNKQ